MHQQLGKGVYRKDTLVLRYDHGVQDAGSDGGVSATAVK